MRDPEGLAGESFDLVIVGGGIYGAMLLLEATRAGLRSLLLEREDFGGATSNNHFRIGHGGLRYLQSLNLVRFRRAVRERRWLISTFPELVRPLRCVMPLYGEALRRPSIMRVALWINDVLSEDRNRQVRPDRRLARSAIISASEAVDTCPVLPSDGLQGAAVWYDTTFLHSNRILVEALLWASEHGAHAQNYVEVVDLITRDGSVQGVVAVDRETDRECAYSADAVVNATGPWSRSFARHVDRDYPDLFRKSRAWNVVFEHEPVADGALAVKPAGRNGRTYFLHARGGRLFAGTGHAPCEPDEEDPHPSDAELADFVTDINRALPELNLSLSEVRGVYAGFLPVKQDRSTHLSERPVLVDHGQQGGPRRLYSVSGVKYTTARYVAEKTVQYVRGKTFAGDVSPLFSYGMARSVRPFQLSAADSGWRGIAEAIIEEESVQHLDDFALRRTDLGDQPDVARTFIDQVAGLFPWSHERRASEIKQLLRKLNDKEEMSVELNE